MTIAVQLIQKFFGVLNNGDVQAILTVLKEGTTRLALTEIVFSVVHTAKRCAAK